MKIVQPATPNRWVTRKWFWAISTRTPLRWELCLCVILAFCAGHPLAAQQANPTGIVFEMVPNDLYRWSDFTEAAIEIKLTNVNRPSDTKQIRIILGPTYRFEPRQVEVQPNFYYRLTEVQDEVLILDHPDFRIPIQVLSLNWPSDSPAILFKAREDKLSAIIISTYVEPGTYTLSAHVTDPRGTIEIANITQGYAEGTTTKLPLKHPSILGNLWDRILRLEGLLAGIILGLVTVLLGVLKDKIKSGFANLFDLLGKYLGGRLAEQRFLTRYLENISFNHKYLKLIGFNTAGVSRPLLEDVFVSLRIAASNVVYESSNKLAQHTSAISFNAAFKRYRCMVILGGPGAGKTTTLSYALLAFAKNKAQQQLGVDEQLLPIYIPLRRLSDTNRPIIEEVTDTATQILSAEILKEYPANYFERKLKKGQCLVLLDGLDEVLDEKTHRQVADRINSLFAAYPLNRFIVTCRTAGWKNLLAGEFAVLSAQDFDRDEIQRFVLGWHKAVITQAEHSRLQLENPEQKKFEEAWEASKESVKSAIDIQSRNLIHAIDSNNRILAIAVNPMLLSLISLVHFNRQYLPRGRTVLYSQCLDLLMDSWDRTRDILSPGTKVTATQKEAILREIAFDFQKRGKGEDSRSNLEQLIATIAVKLGISTPAKDLLEDIETRSGLLTERSLDVFGFTHLTLQEYLVAKHIHLNQGHSGLIAKNFDNQAWREVILLYTGLLGDATELIKGVAASDAPARQRLAGYCVGDSQRCSSEVAQEVVDRLLSDLAQNNDESDEIVNVLASIASDFTAKPISVQEKLSAMLISRITDSTAQITDRLSAIAIMGRARVTRALPGFLLSLKSDEPSISQEALQATVQFGDLALPEIERFLERELDPLDVVHIAYVLASINTGRSALQLLKLYDRFPLSLVSTHLALMMTNPLVEAELLDLETTNLPVALSQGPIDKEGWTYKSVKNGFWFLDTRLRHDIEGAIAYRAKTNVSDEDERFGSISFKILFPAFLSYLRSLPKTFLKQNENGAKDLEIFEVLGFDKAEPNKLKYLINQIKTQFDMPLDLALQRVSNAYEGVSRRVPGDKLWNFLANAFFMIAWVLAIYNAVEVLRFVINFDFSRRTMTVQVVILVTLEIAGALIFLLLIWVTKRKLKRNVFSIQFVGIVLNPIRHFLKILPYVTKYKPSTKLVVFLLLLVCLSRFPYMILHVLANGSSFFLGDLNYGFSLIQPLFLVPLSLYYWKFRVLAQNPVLELITMHPNGRKLVGDTNELPSLTH